MSKDARRPRAARPGDRLAPTLPEERLKISWVTIDRICQEEADSKENVRRELVRNGGGIRLS